MRFAEQRDQAPVSTQSAHELFELMLQNVVTEVATGIIACHGRSGIPQTRINIRGSNFLAFATIQEKN